MKKSHLFVKSILTVLLTFFIAACDQPNMEKEPENQPEDTFQDKVIWESESADGDEFITVLDTAWENDGTVKSDFTGVAPLIQFDKEIDLTGYKYLNIEAYCPDDGYHVIGFTGFSKSPREKVARLQAFSSKEAQIFQTDFGVNNKEWPDYSSGEFQVKESTSNKISEILIFALNPFDGNLPDISDVHICVKKIVATNKKITNDPSKDKVIFKSIEEDGHKFTTQTEEEDWNSNFIYFGDLDLDGYKYINLEISSPNNENYSVNVESWNNSFKTDVESARKLEFSRILTDEMKVYQAPFGVFKQYWFDWRESENYKKTITDNVITYLYISTQDTENEWSWAPGVDVYVKSITATNNKIDNTDTTKDKVVYSAIESDGRKITTKDGRAYLDTGRIDLNGYNYLNIELASPNSGNDVVTMKARDYCNDINGSLVALLTNDFSTFQIPYKGNELRSFTIWASNSENNLQFVSDVDIYIKKIWATNEKLVKDTSKDKLLFEASNQKGVKFTTKENDSIWFNMYEQDLTGYEYLNVEFYSPDAENKVVYLDGWNGDKSVVELGAYLDDTSEIKPRTMQAIIKQNIIGGFSVYACAIDSKDWSQEGIDVYIKKVYATNTKLESDNPKEKTVFSSTEENGFISESTSEGNGYRNIYFGMNDLTGYKYLNIELGIPNRTKDCKFVIDAWGENERVATYDSLMLGDTMVIQSVFGTNNKTWTDWENGETITKKSTSNILRDICVSIEELGKDGKSGGVEFCIKRVWATNTKLENDTTKDKLVFSAVNANGHKFTTADDWKGFGLCDVDLTGYKYLNIEVYSPNSGANSVTLDCWGADENVATFNSILTSEPLILQSVFGTEREVWYKNGVKTPSTSNIFGWLNYGAHYYKENGNRDWFLKPDVDIYIKRIWATNTEYVNDTTKDRNVFISNNDNGYKVTTSNNWENLSVGTRDLTGYKYLNIELYSPNSEGYDIKIDGWGSERVAVFDSKLSNQAKILQVPFGVNRGHWEGEIDGVWQNEIPSTSNELNTFALGAHLGDNWNLKDGLDIYIKRIWATNTKI